MLISVITSYLDRVNSLQLYLEKIKNVDKSKIEFIIVCWKTSKEDIELFNKYHLSYYDLGFEHGFNTALCHNYAVNKSKGKYIFKQDIDTIPKEDDFFDRLIKYVETTNFDYEIIGCDYENNSDLKYGNEYLVKKDDYIKLNGEDTEFQEYGFEDYDFEYRLHKLYNPDFKLGECIMEHVHRKISDMIVRPANNRMRRRGFVLLHHQHTRDNKDGYKDNIMNNRQRLYDKVINEA